MVETVATIEKKRKAMIKMSNNYDCVGMVDDLRGDQVYLLPQDHGGKI